MAILGLLAGFAAAQAIVTTLTLFAGNQTGLLRSTDWGGTWKPVVRRPLDTLGGLRAIHLIGTRVLVGGEGGLFSSDDFGETWVRLPAAPPGIRVVLSTRYPEADPTLLVGTDAGLFRSADGGLHFTPTAVTDPVTRIEWPGPTLIVGTSKGLRLSRDQAVTLLPAGVGLPAGGIDALVMSSMFSADPVVFVSLTSGGVFRSEDGGRRFEPAGLEGIRVNDLHWLGPLLYAATDSGLWRTVDAGVKWEALGEGLGGRSLRRLMFPARPSAAEFFAATDAGVYKTADGGVRFEAVGLKGQGVDVLATFPPPDPTVNKKR